MLAGYGRRLATGASAVLLGGSLEYAASGGRPARCEPAKEPEPEVEDREEGLERYLGYTASLARLKLVMLKAKGAIATGAKLTAAKGAAAAGAKGAAAKAALAAGDAACARVLFRAAAAARCPAMTHYDQSSRPQTVTAADDAWLHALLLAVAARTPCARTAGSAPRTRRAGSPP